MNRLRALAPLLLVLGLASCPKPSPTGGCGPSTCDGCCRGDVCEPGDQDSACGQGTSCVDCAAAGLACVDAACASATSEPDGGTSTDGGLAQPAWVNIGIGSPAQDGTPSFSGRVNALQVVQSDPDVAFLGTAGGGIWRTNDFTSGNPHWQPLTDSLPTASVSALALDPSSPATLYAALGDLDPFFITIHGVLVKSTDQGASFSPPIPVVDAATGVQASIIYDLHVDPSNPNILLVGTDVGLFRSLDAGATFSLLSLGNGGSTQVAKAIHSIAFVGARGGVSSWVVAGVYGCNTGVAPPTFVGSPVTASCPVGNLGDLWRSSDGGNTWTSMREELQTDPSVFPGWAQLADSSTSSGATGLGRIQLASGASASADPGSSVVYALAMAIDGHASVDVLRSLDGGKTWASIWLGGQGTISNPSSGCSDIGVAQRRTGAIAVDPTDPDHLLIGGTACALRTLNGLAASPVWDNVMNGLHVDWRTAGVLLIGATVVAYTGNDGGLNLARTLFSTPRGSESAIQWIPVVDGLITQLAFAVGSGEPADQNGPLVLIGAQDIGAFVRDTGQLWDSVGGGDVSGAAVSGRVLWWGSEILKFCDASASDCRAGSSWKTAAIALPSGDQMDLAAASFSPVVTDPGERVLTHSERNVWLSAPDPTLGWTWTRLTASNLAAPIKSVFASVSSPGLFGAALADGTCAVTGDGLGSSPSWTVSQPLGDGTSTLPSASMVAFPQNVGANAGDVYVASSHANTLVGGGPVPDSVGHLFITHDRGATWQPLHGAGAGADLPNVPISAVRYDPSDATDMAIIVATDRGVFATKDGGATWSPVGVLPGAPVTDLFVSRDGSLLRVSTLGRGAWELAR